VTNEEIQAFAEQLVKALGGPLAAALQQNVKVLLAALEQAQQERRQFVTRAQFEQFIFTSNGLFPSKKSHNQNTYETSSF
jgi:hypothetical protein